jgi:alanine racemase
MAKRHIELIQEGFRPKLSGLDDTGSSLITLTVDLDIVRENLKTILDYVSPAKLIAVLKANAYGFGVSGLVPILNEFEHVSAGVANADEALELRSLGYDGRILLLGYTHPKNYYQIIHSGCELCAYRPENIPKLAEACSALEHNLRLHIKVNTGMNRLGVSVDELREFIRLIQQYPQLTVVGLFTHMANGGEPDEPSNLEQANRFNQAVNIAIEELNYRPECHLANSGTVINFPDLYLDTVRVGALCYGYHPPGGLPDDIGIPVEACFELASEVIDTHRLEPGEGVSYSLTWRAERPTTVVTMPLGFADGYFRDLSNNAAVLINGKRYPLVGNITMDYCMADVGDDEVGIGDEAVFIGCQGDEEIRLEEVAELSGEAVIYQLSCCWGRRVRRVYIGG